MILRNSPLDLAPSQAQGGTNTSHTLCLPEQSTNRQCFTDPLLPPSLPFKQLSYFALITGIHMQPGDTYTHTHKSNMLSMEDLFLCPLQIMTGFPLTWQRNSQSPVKLAFMFKLQSKWKEDSWLCVKDQLELHLQQLERVHCKGKRAKSKHKLLSSSKLYKSRGSLGSSGFQYILKWFN